jgi:hypothetical protein
VRFSSHAFGSNAADYRPTFPAPAEGELALVRAKGPLHGADNVSAFAQSSKRGLEVGPNLPTSRVDLAGQA